MKKIAIIVSTLAFCLAMVSCGEKCTTCTFTYEVNGVSTDFPQNQVCGSKSEVDAYKATVQAAAELAGGAGATSACVDD